MKILWVTNLALPEANKLLNLEGSPFGGWLVSSSRDLSDSGVDLEICYPFSGEPHILMGDKIKYHSFSRKNRHQFEEISRIIEKVEPDIVHVFGTEYQHSFLTTEICKEKDIKCVISIQGLISVYKNHLRANLPDYVLKGKTLRNFIFRDNINDSIKEFSKRGKYEVLAIENVQHVIGRTTWDRAATRQLNPEAMYHFCNETLRDGFYDNNWNINEIERNTIFMSQAGYSIKGLHYLLDALSIVKKTHPNVKLYIAGRNLLDKSSIKMLLKRNYYDKYIESIIKSKKLENNVIFLGTLNEEGMIDKNLKSHLYVIPSTIENSPNSLAEAMVLGMPVIASYVGGTPDMVAHYENGILYQADSSEMLAHSIIEVFDNDTLSLKISSQAKEDGLKRHDRYLNTQQLLEIYKKINETGLW